MCLHRLSSWNWTFWKEGQHVGVWQRKQYIDGLVQERRNSSALAIVTSFLHLPIDMIWEKCVIGSTANDHKTKQELLEIVALENIARRIVVTVSQFSWCFFCWHFIFILRRHDNISPCIESRSNANNERIASSVHTHTRKQHRNTHTYKHTQSTHVLCLLLMAWHLFGTNAYNAKHYDDGRSLDACQRCL